MEHGIATGGVSPASRCGERVLFRRRRGGSYPPARIAASVLSALRIYKRANLRICQTGWYRGFPVPVQRVCALHGGGFYIWKTRRANEKLAAVLRELSWTNNLLVMSGSTEEERAFYLTLAVKNRYSSRELKRQMDSCLYERTMLSESSGKLIAEVGGTCRRFG